ncbi:MAG: hypothetical protein D6705_13080 [Deltaproteobacteria bacterium]|nr:MAG: hypothetical protein D6705_13080 [Deltaproteobacteria bacterium]
MCDGEVCVPEAPATEAATGEPPSNERKKRKRRRRRSKRADDTAEDASGADFVPPDDRHVPAYRDDRGQVIDENSGSERLSDRAVRRHMRTLEPAFNRCIEKAAMASDEDLGSGTVSFRINVDPDGKVAGVSVDAPKNLRVFGIVPCMRIAVHRSRFPTWNGPPMRVEYSFRVE